MDLKYALKRRYAITLFGFKDSIKNFAGTKALDYKKKKLLIHVDNVREHLTRANSCQKEPETVKWIERNSGKNLVMYEIGANIGQYSLVAAANKIKVLAFEPGFSNFNTLNKNITLNNFDNKISAFNLAFSRETKVEKFKYHDITSGTSLCFYNEEGYYKTKKNSKKLIEKDTLIYSLDNFIKTFKLPSAQLLKIDVDGAEYEIICGAKETLSNKKLKSIIIEVDEDIKNSSEIQKIIEKSGFKLEGKYNRNGSVYNCVYNRK